VTPHANPLHDRAERDLEWTRLTAAVLNRCNGESAKRRGVPLAATLEATLRGMRETAEALRLMQNGDPLPLSGLRDVEEHLGRLERQGTLDGPALGDVMALLRVGSTLRRYLSSHRATASALSDACAIDPSLDQLSDALADSMDEHGILHDHASTTLHKLRREVADLRERIVGRLEQLMTEHAALLSDRFYTLREGRYVLPVRSDAHEPFNGIVHTASVSGATVFVEPRAIVQLGNRLKIAEAELEREQERLYAELSARVHERLPVVLACATAIDHADLRNACARLAVDTHAHIPQLVATPSIRLVAARHPLLALDGKQVVENDIDIAAGQALIISGPNAGGKTVALKLLGLAALMVRAGLALPADETSHCGFFGDVLTDIGDDQSTLKDLSTFSAHVKNLAAVLSQAGTGTLVLLDELAGGTDPEEGSALSCAVVEALCENNAAVVVTTHYEALKARAARGGVMRNASVGFDIAKLAPTFQLMMNVPGASSALAVARRFGIPEAVVARAEANVPEHVRHFDDLAGQLSTALTQARDRQRVLDDKEVVLAAKERDLLERHDRLREQSQRKLSAELNALMDNLRTARGELAEARRVLKKQDREQLHAAASTIERLTSRVAIGGDLATSPAEPEPAATPDFQPKLGDSVYVARLRTVGSVVEGPLKGKTRVAVGGMKLWVETNELRPPPARNGNSNAAQEKPVPTVHAAAAPAQPQPLERHSDNTVDVRGMRADDAVGMVESFIDRLYGGSQRAGFVLHGHGTGALRNTIREHLQNALAHVTHHRPGTRDEGGEAVTAFFLQ